MTSEDDEVAKFDGKIVYNPDGSAYIIDGDDGLDHELPQQEGSIVEKTGEETNPNPNYPSISNALYVSKSTDYFNALYGQAYVKMLQEKNVPDTPVVHSYRVKSYRDGGSSSVSKDESNNTLPSNVPVVVPVKPILMCFVCKLSFACQKLFGTHCIESHQV